MEVTVDLYLTGVLCKLHLSNVSKPLGEKNPKLQYQTAYSIEESRAYCIFKETHLI